MKRMQIAVIALCAVGLSLAVLACASSASTELAGYFCIFGLVLLLRAGWKADWIAETKIPTDETVKLKAISMDREQKEKKPSKSKTWEKATYRLNSRKINVISIKTRLTDGGNSSWLGKYGNPLCATLA